MESGLLAVVRAEDSRANEQAMVVLLVGLMEPVHRYPGVAEARLFARNVVARLSNPEPSK